MTPTEVIINGRLYYTTNRAARYLGVSDRTLLRWKSWSENGHCPEVLRHLRWRRHPVNGFNYYCAASLLLTRRLIVAGQRICPNQCRHSSTRY